MARTAFHLCAALTATIIASLLFPHPSFALEHTVRRGETLFSVARTYRLDPAALAKANGLPPDSRLRAGAKLTVPGLKDAMPDPLADHRELLKGGSGTGVKAVGRTAPAEAGARPKGVVLTPNVLPAAESMTPRATVDRDPKTFRRSGAGVRASFLTDPETEIIGIVGTPDGPSGSLRPWGKPETQTGVTPSAGVLLKRSF